MFDIDKVRILSEYLLQCEKNINGDGEKYFCKVCKSILTYAYVYTDYYDPNHLLDLMMDVKLHHQNCVFADLLRESK